VNPYQTAMEYLLGGACKRCTGLGELFHRESRQYQGSVVRNNWGTVCPECEGSGFSNTTVGGIK
jgi:hypothetical protein